MGQLGSYTDASALTGTERFLCVQGGATREATPEQIKTFTNRIFYKNHVAVSGPTDTNEKLMDSILIPAGTVSETSRIRIVTATTKTGGIANLTVRRRIHTSAALAGTIIESVIINNPWSKVDREIVFLNSLSNSAYQAATGVNDDIVTSNTAYTALTNNFSVDQYIIISHQLANASDSSSLLYWYVEIY